MPRMRCSRTAIALLAAAITATAGATALGAAPAAMAANDVPNLAGGPAVYDPASHYLELYAVGTDGGLYEDVWEPSGFPNPGWSGWLPKGGSLTGTASAIYDSVSNRLEVFARGINGPLFEKYWHPGSGFSSWIDLGGSITGSPAAINDPASGNIEVYCTGADGTLQQFVFNPHTGTWSGPINLGGSITGDPAPVYDTATGHLEVYARGKDGSLYQKYWSSSTGWSAWNPLQGSITGSPAPAYNPASGNLEVYMTGSDGTLQQKVFKPGSGWEPLVSLGGSIANTPSPVYDAADDDDVFNVFAVGAGGPLFQIGWSPAPGWSKWQDLDIGGSLTGSPDALYDTASGNLEAYVLTSAGTVFEAWYNGTWHTQDLGGSLSGL